MSISALFSRMLDNSLDLGQALLAHGATSNEAMVFIHRDGHMSELRYATLATQAAHQANALHKLGLVPGEPVLIVCDDEQRLVTLLWSVWLAGAVAVPLGAPGSRTGSDAATRKLSAVASQALWP